MSSDTRMPSAELQTVREYLGLTIDAMARLLHVNPRTVRSWEAGRDPIPTRIREEVEAIEAYTAEVVGHVVGELNDAADAIIAVYRTNDDFARERPDLAADGFTARWWRHVVARVAHEVPGLVIVSPDEVEDIIEEAVEAELRDGLD